MGIEFYKENQPGIDFEKKTKRSEKEVDIKPMIYDFHYEDRGIFLKLATGSEQNLKPELVMETFLKFMSIDPETYSMHYHRLEVYAKKKEGFVSLEALGTEIYE